ncbi:MAG: carboxypeptidase regulatory-like domain-containing protein [Terracidiphilus sp.]
MRHFLLFVLAVALGSAGIAVRAQGAGPAQPAAAASIHGHIADPTGALIPGAKVAVTNPLGVPVKTTVSNAIGDYKVAGLAPGKYIVEAQMPGFALFTSPTFALAGSQSRRMDISMALQVAQQQVEVSGSGGPAVSTAPGENTNAIVLKGKALEALSDDPDELANELEALAGPSAGPNGGQIYIDGFTGGQLPPKSAIREIRINANPFSAEYDRLGYGRIEILTKPGTDHFEGRVFGMGNDSSFNTLNPFTGAIPSYHSYMVNGTVSGPISKSASYFFSIFQRNNQNDNIYTAIVPVLNSSTGLYSVPTDSNGNPIPTTGGLFSPETMINVSPRVDLELGQFNTLTLRYQFFRRNRSNSLGGDTSLPTQASSSDSIEHTFQLDDTQIVNSNLVNETRFEYRRGIDSETPASTEPSFSVPSYFTGGGNGAQFSNDHTDHFELQNISTWTLGPQTITFGTWDRDNREAVSTNGGFNGSFSFPSIDSYLDTINGQAQGLTVAQIAAACPSGQTCTPIELGYTTGPENFAANVFDGALYYQDDWKVNPFLTLSGGLRFETQNHVSDHADWAPRFAFAYALDGHKKGAKQKTVVRGGYGFFYDRFGEDDLMNLEQFNGGPNTQKQTVIKDPTCFSSTSLSDIGSSPAAIEAACGSGAAAAPQIDTIAPHYHSPYTEMLGLSLERQLTKSTTLTVTYLHAYGVHHLVVRDSNAYEPLPGTTFYNSTTGPRPDPSLGIVDQYYPEGFYKESQIIVNFNTSLSRNFSLFGFYNYSHADTDGGGGHNPSNSYDLMQDYGRASWVHPQWMLLVGDYTGPWGLTFNPFLIAHQGEPYNISTSTDLTGDNFFNDRPAYASSSDCPSTSANYVSTPFGCLDTNPGQGASLVPANLGNSPSSVALNLRVSRTFGVGPKGETAGGPPPRGGGGRHFHIGGPFGGSSNPFHHGPAATSRKYALTFSAQALNLFNDVDYGSPSGSLIPTLNSSTGLYAPDSRFGQSTGLAGGIFSSGSAVRRIFFQAAFQF